MRIPLLILAALAPVPAVASDGDPSSAAPFIFGLLGAVPVLVPVLWFFIKIGRELGGRETEWKSLVERVDKLSARVEEGHKEIRMEVNVHGGNLASRTEGAVRDMSQRLDGFIADIRANYVNKEHLVLRLTAIEAKIEADVARSMAGTHPPKGQP